MNRRPTPEIVELLDELSDKSLPSSLFEFNPIVRADDFKEEVIQWLKHEEPLSTQSLPPHEVQFTPTAKVDIEFGQDWLFQTDLNRSSASYSPSSSSFTSSEDRSYPEIFSSPEPHFFWPIAEEISPDSRYFPLVPVASSPSMSPDRDDFECNENSTLSKIHYKQLYGKKFTPNRRCINCQTTETPLWRRNKQGEDECNACKTYRTRNGCIRPVQFHGRMVQSRIRKARRQVLP